MRKTLPGGESNPGLPRDRRGYSPLYYRGHSLDGCDSLFEWNDTLLGQNANFSSRHNERVKIGLKCVNVENFGTYFFQVTLSSQMFSCY